MRPGKQKKAATSAESVVDEERGRVLITGGRLRPQRSSKPSPESNVQGRANLTIQASDSKPFTV